MERKVLTIEGGSPNDHPCWLGGGLMFFANPELAKNVIRKHIEQSVCDYLAYCAICRDYLSSRASGRWHILDLVRGPEEDEAAQSRGPGYTLRYEKRVRLKNRMLKDLWREAMIERQDYENIRLSFSDELRVLMEERQIHDSDIQQVIDFAEKNGTKLLNRKTGHFLAHHKPGAVTYWVEYTVGEGEFFIHNAYSHRMEVI